MATRRLNDLMNHAGTPRLRHISVLLGAAEGGGETQTVTGFGYSSFGDPGGWLFSNVVNQNFVRAALNHPQTALLSFILLWLHYGGLHTEFSANITETETILVLLNYSWRFIFYLNLTNVLSTRTLLDNFYLVIHSLFIWMFHSFTKRGENTLAGNKNKPYQHFVSGVSHLQWRLLFQINQTNWLKWRE